MNFEVSGFHAMNLEDDPSVKEVSVEKTGFRVCTGIGPGNTQASFALQREDQDLEDEHRMLGVGTGVRE